MIVHIGWDTAVSLSRVLMVVSAKSAGSAHETREIIECARREGRFTACPEQEKAYVLLQDGEEPLQVLASSISPTTIQRRMMQAWELGEP